GTVGLFRSTDSRLEAEHGRAVGTACIKMAAQADTGASANLELLQREADHLVEIFREGSFGGVTSAGKIASISVSELTSCNESSWHQGDDGLVPLHDPVWGDKEVQWKH